MYEDIVHFPIVTGENVFNIQICGISYCDGTYKINRPDSPVWCIEYIRKGKGIVWVNSESFVARSGDIYILPANTNHFYYSDNAEPWEKIWFNISGKLVNSLMEVYSLKGIYHIENLNLNNIFEEFVETARNSDSFKNAQLQCSAIFMKIVQKMSEHVNTVNTAAVKTLATRLKRKIDMITDYSVTFDEIIAEFYCSKSHIIRSFKAEYKITPYQYLLSKKTIYAKELIQSTAMSMTEIAYRLGFNDCHYFSNFFKKTTGLTPVEYKKSLNNYL